MGYQLAEPREIVAGAELAPLNLNTGAINFQITLFNQVAEQREAEASRAAAEKERAKAEQSRRSNRQGIGEAFTKSVVRTVGNRLARELVRGLLGTFSRR